MTCRECSATPAERGDAVAETAVAYTCSRCLVGWKRPSEAGPAMGVQGAENEAQGTRINSGDSTRVSVTPQATRERPGPRVGARRGGRPRKYATDAIASRESSRAYRERRKVVR